MLFVFLFSSAIVSRISLSMRCERRQRDSRGIRVYPLTFAIFICRMCSRLSLCPISLILSYLLVSVFAQRYEGISNTMCCSVRTKEIFNFHIDLYYWLCSLFFIYSYKANKNNRQIRTTCIFSTYIFTNLQETSS